LAKFDNLLVPTLDLASIPPSGSVFHSNGAGKVYSPPAYAPDDPWSTPSRMPASTPSVTSPPAPGSGVRTQSSSAIIGTGLAPGWWDQDKTVKVALKGLQGFILKRYTVYEVTSPVRSILNNPKPIPNIIFYSKGKQYPVVTRNLCSSMIA
jgi:sorting nexin-8